VATPTSPPVSRAYLAGPMSGLPRHNFPAFDRAALLLREVLAFDEVVSPAELTYDDERRTGVPAGTQPWSHYMRQDIRALVDCDAIVLLPGWETSRGATLELTVARALGLDAWTFEERHDDGWRLSPLPPVDPLSDPASRKDAHANETVCAEADRLVSDDRQAAYGHPQDNYSLLADLVSPIVARRLLGVDAVTAGGYPTLTASDLALVMVQVKVARELNHPKRDNRVDLCGYAKVLDMIETAP